MPSEDHFVRGLRSRTDMLRFIVVLCLAGATLAVPLERASSPNGRIIGGNNTVVTKYPYQVAIELTTIYWCGGAILNTRYVLTAAQCFDELPTVYRVRAGSSVRAQQGVLHQIEEYIIHPQWESHGHDYDVALVRVAKPFTYTDLVRPIALPAQGEEVAEGTVAVTTGFGPLTESGLTALLLKEVAVPILNNEDCNNVYDGSITPRMICAGYIEGGRGFCPRDAGSPMVAEGKLMGVVSWGIGCAREGYPGVYVRVAALRDWIAENAGV